MKQQSGSVNMRVLPVPPNALSGVIGILTSEEEKDDTPFFKVLLKIITDNLKNAVNLIKQHYMWLVPLAANPTYAQLESFMLSDTTDQNTYVPGVYECTDFARDVYNNAEKAGIRTAYVGMVFSVSKIGHALDAFQTTDKGLVFIDCTGLEAGEAGPSDNDKIVTVKKGDYYTYIYMDEVNGPQLHRTDLGTITDVQLDW